MIALPDGIAPADSGKAGGAPCRCRLHGTGRSALAHGRVLWRRLGLVPAIDAADAQSWGRYTNALEGRTRVCDLRPFCCVFAWPPVLRFPKTPYRKTLRDHPMRIARGDESGCGRIAL